MDNGYDALDNLFWRDEILQIMYWFQGEGFGDIFAPADLRRFLADDAPELTPYLEIMIADGLLERAMMNKYRLTKFGHREAARRFRDAFEGLTKPTHGECSADCECHRTGNPEDCVNRKHEHVHA